MSAPIPSFFKIRCVLVIISLLLFFMLIGMTRRAFAACDGTQEDGSCVQYVYTCTDAVTTLSSTNIVTSAVLNSTCSPVQASLSSFPSGTSYCKNVVIRKLKRSAGSATWVVNGVYNLNPVLPDVIGFGQRLPDFSSYDDVDCPDDCTDEEEDLASQCGEIGYTMIDEENCKGRCNDCVQEAEAQCPSPDIIVWNEDGDCSYNCSKDTDGDGWPDIEDPDDDNDDPCPTNPDPECVKPQGPDTDGDGTPDVSDPDADMDGDGIPNSEDDDDDGDGVPDNLDLDADPDGDGLLNWEDDDDDGDGIPDAEDPDHDSDYDGIPNGEDDDDDGDGVPDVEDPDNDKYSNNRSEYSWTSGIGEQISSRFNSFIDEMKSSSVFSIPGQIFGSGGIPTGGSPSIEFDGGENFGGPQTIDLSNWSSGLAVMRAALYALFAAVAVKIALLGR